jgi:hypothetical protein
MARVSYDVEIEYLQEQHTSSIFSRSLMYAISPLISSNIMLHKIEHFITT